MGTLELSNLIQLEINENLRNISIPKKGVVFGVDGDIEVNRVAFVFPRYYSNFDMTEFSARVNYVNANGEANYYEADDMSSDDGDTATFSWLMTSDVTSYIGEVRFSVLLYKQLDERYVKKFGTRPATGRVLEGLDVESYVTPEQQLTLIEKMEKKFDAYVEAKILGVNHDIEDAKNGALDSIEEAKNDVDSFIISSKSEIDTLRSSSLDDIKNLTDTSKLNISTLTDEKLASLDEETVRQLKNIELAGVEETEKIRTAFSSAVSDIQAEGQKQADAVDSHGDSKIKEINDSTATSLANINSISEKQVEAIQLEGTKQTSSVSSEGNKQVSTVTSAGATEVIKVKSASSTALSNIGSAKESSISKITAKGTEQVKIIKDTSANEISKVQAAGTSQVKSVSDEGKIQIDGVKSEGEKQVQSVSAKGTQSLQDIDTAKTAAVKSVNDQTKPIIDKVEQLKQNVNDKSDSVDEAYEQMKKLHCIEISEEAPTNERTGLWVNPKSNEEINIPEIKDEEVSGIDTWSSQKINHEIDSLKEEIANQTGTRLSTEAIDKLEEVGNYLVYATADGGSKWTELIAILRNGSSGSGSGEAVPATGISLDKTTLSFTDSATQTLTATVEPSNSTDSVTWETSNAGVATVSSGVVLPVSNGSCTITAKAGSYSASCEVTVAVESEIVTYTITNKLTNVSTDNPVTTITKNSPYEANLTPSTDYEFDSVTVTMGGVDITSDVYADGAIVISAVTGNIIITASAGEPESGELVFLDYVELSGGAYFDTGITSNLKNKYLIGVMSPEITDSQFIWGARARNNTSLDTSDYYDDTFALCSSSGADRYTKGNPHKFYMYDSQSMQGINGSDNKSYLVPWYLYTKWDASCLEAYSNEEMTSPLGASTFIKKSLTSNHFPYALNINVNGAEITLDPEKHAPSNVYLGKVNTTLGSDNMSKYPVPVDGMKYYVYKVWSESDVLLMHLRPAKMGTKVGMYDVVSSAFFESPDGTVTAGSEVAQ